MTDENVETGSLCKKCKTGRVALIFASVSEGDMDDEPYKSGVAEGNGQTIQFREPIILTIYACDGCGYVYSTLIDSGDVESESTAEIRQSSLWIVVKDMLARDSKLEVDPPDEYKTTIKKGEIIEFRYHYGIHFRNKENKYFFVEEDVLLKHCDLYGQVLEKTRWENQKTLSEILDEGLYIT